MGAPVSGRKASDLTQEEFDNLLGFLDPSAEVAGQKYEEIRRRLNKIFTCRGCTSPEELVDKSIDRRGRY